MYRCAPAGVPNGKVTSEQLILLIRGPRLAGADIKVGVATEQLSLRCGRLEFGGKHANRNASRAVDAARTIRDRLTSAKTDPTKGFIKFASVAAT